MSDLKLSVSHHLLTPLKKAKATAALPSLMDKRSQYGSDWRNGLWGFGKEEDKNYLGLECFIDNLDDEGGDLLTNKRIDSRDTITVALTRIQVDPVIPNPKFVRRQKHQTKRQNSEQASTSTRSITLR
jgi:hypothetical protein